MAYKRKTVDRWDILGNCGYGWEVENSEYTREDAKRSLKEYRENYYPPYIGVGQMVRQGN